MNEWLWLKSKPSPVEWLSSKQLYQEDVCIISLKVAVTIQIYVTNNIVWSKVNKFTSTSFIESIQASESDMLKPSMIIVAHKICRLRRWFCFSVLGVIGSLTGSLIDLLLGLLLLLLLMLDIGCVKRAIYWKYTIAIDDGFTTSAWDQIGSIEEDLTALIHSNLTYLRRWGRLLSLR